MPDHDALADKLATLNPGMATTYRATSNDWKSRAWSAVEQLAREGRPFQAYDVVQRFGIEEPDNPAKQWGALLNAMRAAKVIVPAGGEPSRRPGAKGSMCRTWIGATQNPTPASERPAA
ncbi:hypothetical protein [Nocardiopsis sp. FR26]|uniref:hypothetical protein n=1 Tax=Nocardiopsis sp. FR26 TaxID=2605987 RepID=UPI00135674D6|nr:hypothetical protein [Nocardiopsis sp. FR26]